MLANSTRTELGATTGATPLLVALGIAHVLITDDTSTWAGRHASDTLDEEPNMPSTVMGWWNGSDYVPLEAIGVWDGTTFTPVNLEEEG